VGLRAGLDAGTRRKILCLCRGSTLHSEFLIVSTSYMTHDIFKTIKIVFNFSILFNKRCVKTKIVK
jgi:hypothetical protein